MSKKVNTVGGGAQTNKNGLKFEQTTSLDEALATYGYEIRKHKVFKGETLIGLSLQKRKLYKYFLEKKEIDYMNYISKRLEPDDAFINFKNKTVYILEKKFQNGAGSVDEKLQTCDFKKKQYTKLFNPIGYKCEYAYILCDWFKDPKYKDVLDYIESMGCYYFFNTVPLKYLGL